MPDHPRRTLLVVCHANIARSPTAEVIGRSLLRPDSDWQIASAGVRAIPGAPMDDTLAEEVRRRGVDPSGHRSRQLTGVIANGADLILTFEAAHRSWVLGQYPRLMRRTMTVRRAARLLADRPRRASALDYLAADDRRYGPDDDFADPFGLGPEAAQRAVGEIERLLGVILPALED